MKKILNFLLIIATVCLSSVAKTDELNLNKLLSKLKDCNSQSEAKILEKSIWNLWETHPSNFQLTIDLKEGSRLVQNGNYIKAYGIFSKIIEKDPNWAEAWNRRATSLYFMGKYKKSLNDIDMVLKLESRHFGALIGKGQVYMEMKEYEKAYNSYLESSYINPMNTDTIYQINKVSKLIKEKTI